MNIDALVDYQLASIPETTEVVNPAWRQLDGQVRKRAAELAKLKGEFASHTLQGVIEKDQVEPFLERKEQLIQQIYCYKCLFLFAMLQPVNSEGESSLLF